MTATQMLQEFLLGINQANNQVLFSGDVARFLNQAQEDLVNDYVYDTEAQPNVMEPPRRSFENNLRVSEAISVLKTTVSLVSTSKGFFPYPANHRQTISVKLFKKDPNVFPDCGPDNVIEARFTTDNKIQQMIENRFMRPTWNEGKALYRYNPFFITESVNGQAGIRIFPNQRFLGDFRFIRNPRQIVIAATPNEQFLYAGNPGFVLPTADVDSELPASVHPYLVRRAIRLYEASRPDAQQFAIESQLTAEGE